MIGAPRRDVVEQVLGEVAVRVDDAHALTGLDVLKDEVSEQRGFARARLADHVEVLAAIGTFKKEGLGSSPVISRADVNGMVFIVIVHVPEQAPTPSRRSFARADAAGVLQKRTAGKRAGLRAGRVMET